MGVDLRGQRVLISGATGFIGANLVHRTIKEGAQVRGISRGVMEPWRLENVHPEFGLIPVDMADGDRVEHVVREISPDYILHCAVARPQSHDRRTSTLLEANLTGVRNLLEAADQVHPKRCVMLGSSLEYARKAGPMREEDRIDPDTDFGASKAAATQFAQTFARQSKFPITILRPFSVYGPWEDGNRLIPRSILAALRGGDLALTKPGHRHDFVHVDDVVNACVACLTRPTLPIGDVYNVGTGTQWTNEEVVGMIEQVSGREVRVRREIYPSGEFDRPSWAADIKKARVGLDWEPVALPSGLKKTVNWFRANQHRYSE